MFLPILFIVLCIIILWYNPVTKCQHYYVKISFEEREASNLRYSVRTYQCKHCGKKIKKDGRYYDPYL